MNKVFLMGVCVLLSALAFAAEYSITVEPVHARPNSLSVPIRIDISCMGEGSRVRAHISSENDKIIPVLGYQLIDFREKDTATALFSVQIGNVPDGNYPLKLTLSGRFRLQFLGRLRLL